MARIRSIKPDAFTSESLSAVPVGARWTFAGLWTYADDEGRARSDVRLIKAALYPLDDEASIEEIEHHLKELERIGAICRYSSQGRHYLHVVNFDKHQRVNRSTPSVLPDCPRTSHDASPDHSLSAHGGLTEDSCPPARAPEVEVEVEVEVEQGTVVVASRADVEALCAHLADKIEQNGSRRPTVTAKWRDACRLMLDKDARTEDQIRGAIDWSQADEFWRANILSMPTLREKYDQLRLAASRRRSGDAQTEVDQLFDRAAARMASRQASA